MPYSLSFLPEVEDDVMSAYFWYEEKSRGLGEEFLRIFYASSAEIARIPNLYQKVYKISIVVFSKDFPTLFILLSKRKQLLYMAYFIALEILILYKKE